MPQGHCIISSVACLQSQRQLQWVQSCSIIVERCLEQLYFQLLSERSVQISLFRQNQI